MNRPGFLRRLVWLAPLAMAMACAEPDPYEGPTELDARAAVGAVEGTDIVLGALIDGDSLNVYQCGGDQTFATHTGWFRGVIGNGDDLDAFELVLGDMQLRGSRDEDGLEGELVEADGSEHHFRVDAVADDDEAGVYVADVGDVHVGVVVRPDANGELVAQGASCEGTLPCTQVIILAPLTITDEKIDVQVDTQSGQLDIQVTRTLTPS